MDDVKAGVPKRYDIVSDEFVAVDQKWVDSVERFFQKFGKARETGKRAVEAQQAFLDAWKPEFERKK
jgi:hypothetical protein